MTLQPGKQVIAIHISYSISESKRNKTMKFVQLIEYKRWETFFLKNQS